MHWIEGSGKVLSAVATLNGVAKRRRKRSEASLSGLNSVSA